MQPISLAPSLKAAGTPPDEAAAAAELRRARISVSLVFFANGFVVASWLPHIPEVKERLGLDDFLLGIALFSMAAGSVVVLPLAGWSAGRFGSDATTRTAALALCLLLPGAVVAPNFVTLVLALLLPARTTARPRPIPAPANPRRPPRAIPGSTCRRVPA